MTGSGLVGISAAPEVCGGSRTRLDLANVYHDAQEIIRAGSGEFQVLAGVVTLDSIRVRQHVQLQGELDRRVDLGRLVVPPLLVLEPLRRR